MDQTHSILFYFHSAARPSRHRRRRRRPRANEAQRRRRGRRTCRRADVASRRRTSCAVARRLLLVTGQEIDNALKCMPMCRLSRACDGRNKEIWCREECCQRTRNLLGAPTWLPHQGHPRHRGQFVQVRLPGRAHDLQQRLGRRVGRGRAARVEARLHRQGPRSRQADRRVQQCATLMTCRQHAIG